eukprot:SM000137S00444  [mRNA]  locus=s137:142093:148002:- [translate_table: standard]
MARCCTGSWRGPQPSKMAVALSRLWQSACAAAGSASSVRRAKAITEAVEVVAAVPDVEVLAGGGARAVADDLAERGPAAVQVAGGVGGGENSFQSAVRARRAKRRETRASPLPSPPPPAPLAAALLRGHIQTHSRGSPARTRLAFTAAPARSTPTPASPLTPVRRGAACHRADALPLDLGLARRRASSCPSSTAPPHTPPSSPAAGPRAAAHPAAPSGLPKCRAVDHAVLEGPGAGPRSAAAVALPQAALGRPDDDAAARGAENGWRPELSERHSSWQRQQQQKPGTTLRVTDVASLGRHGDTTRRRKSGTPNELNSSQSPLAAGECGTCVLQDAVPPLELGRQAELTDCPNFATRLPDDGGPRERVLLDILLHGLEAVCTGSSSSVQSRLEQQSAGGHAVALATADEESRGGGESVAASEAGRPLRLRHVGLDEFKRVLQQQLDTGAKDSRPSRQLTSRRSSTDGSRYNYAAATHGAKVIDYSKEAKGASSVLDEDKDKYLRIPCSADEKFVVIELSEEARVDAVVISNFEYYASSVKDFEVQVAQEHPPAAWQSLGHYSALNIRTPQVFEVPEAAQAWARYVKLRLETYHGGEFYCTLSLVRVHGVDALESLKEDLAALDDPNGSPAFALPSSAAAEPAAIVGASLLVAHAAESQTVQNMLVSGEAHFTAAEAVQPVASDMKVIAMPAALLEEIGGSMQISMDKRKPEQTEPRGALDELPVEVLAGAQGDMREAGAEGPAALNVTDAGSSFPLAQEATKNVTTGIEQEPVTMKDETLLSAGSQMAARAGGDYIFKTLMQRIRSLELNQSLVNQYIDNLSEKYVVTLSEYDAELTVLQRTLSNTSNTISALASRLLTLEERSGELVTLEKDTQVELMASLADFQNLRAKVGDMERRESLLAIIASASFVLALYAVFWRNQPAARIFASEARAQDAHLSLALDLGCLVRIALRNHKAEDEGAGPAEEQPRDGVAARQLKEAATRSGELEAFQAQK